MDYKGLYDSLMEKGRLRSIEGYKEKHHIIPRCLGGSNAAENIVELLPEEHFMAHLLLLKIYPDAEKLSYSMLMMASRRGVKINSKIYGMLKRKVSLAKTGKKHTKETKELISRKKAGKPSPKKGVPISEDQKLKISAANKGNPSPNKGKKLTLEQREHLARINTGKTQSEETRAKRSATMRGRKGNSPSLETREKIASKLRGVRLSPESRTKQAASLSYRLQCKKYRSEILGLWQAL